MDAIGMYGEGILKMALNLSVQRHFYMKESDEWSSRFFSSRYLFCGYSWRTALYMKNNIDVSRWGILSFIEVMKYIIVKFACYPDSYSDHLILSMYT